MGKKRYIVEEIDDKKSDPGNIFLGCIGVVVLLTMIAGAIKGCTEALFG